jgi:hypothetical protein
MVCDVSQLPQKLYPSCSSSSLSMHHLFVDHSIELHSNTLQCVVVFNYVVFFILWFHKFLTMYVFGVKSHYGDYLFKKKGLLL